MRFSPPNPFPRQSLPDLEGAERALETFWAEGPALVLVGHRDCATTRLTLPFVDRLHRRRRDKTHVVAVLQDDPEEARGLAADLGLELPILVEADPYPLAAALDLRTAPTLMLVGTDGRIEASYEGFRRDDLQALALAVGNREPLFAPDDGAPAQKPG